MTNLAQTPKNVSAGVEAGMSIQEFLAGNPSLSDILNFVNKEAERIVSEKKKMTGSVVVEGAKKAV